MNVTLNDIARLIGASVPAGSEHREINGVNSLEQAGPRELSFLSNPKYARFFAETRAAAVIVDGGSSLPETAVPLVVDDPYLAFLKVLSLFDRRDPRSIASGIDENSSIHPTARLGADVSVGPFAFLGEDVEVGDGTVIGSCTVVMKGSTIGKSCILYPNVTIMDDCHIGDRVILQAGSVIGSDGFGFAPHEGRLVKIPQIGGVRIADDVEIQACTCVDRAVFGETVIEKGVKVDNLVQIAHNVRIGPGTVIASQVGVSGSTHIGGGVKVGGQAGFAGHIEVGEGVFVAGRAGVTKDIPGGIVVSGYPAINHGEHLRIEASMKKAPELFKTVRTLEKRIEELERRLEDV
ncbi:MAG: UDP-3-O-(3-hydroxymyristoyl)glucosamine N-acyltransferase [Candidatus Latescibacteria bacterium]|nr:UDP-3-O-(3-hydroxymyristoyl)glucosamine N-acyltransferase [Candidatus Latescibacterota bacterium]